MSKMAELPVTMLGLRPLIDAKINNKDVRFEVDSGAFYSMISAASAAELNLKIGAAPYGMRVTGIGGITKPSVATVDVFTLAGIPVRNMQFLVGGSLDTLDSGSAGLLGQNVFGVSDVEYDLANGKIRFIKSDDCPRAMLAYWVGGGQAYSVVDIDPISVYHPHITSSAYLNGTKIAVTFDTGANLSLLSLRAAARAGMDPKSTGVVEAGLVGGIGTGAIKSYVGTFSSFKLGDEEVQHAKLRFGGSLGIDTEMLVGADFFLSHRVYVATSQHKMYFTYNGGPVFNLSAQSKVEKSAEPAEDHAPFEADPWNAKRPGGESILGRMSELMFVEVIRQYVETLPEVQRGWLAGLRDRQVGRALNLIHGAPGQDWTLEKMAGTVGLSRSSLAERFSDYVGVPPMQYLTNWRMQLATGLLQDGADSIAAIACQVGYESEAAFSRAFKREMGKSPGAWRAG